MAGFERGVRPIGDWSMLMILSILSDALDLLVGAGPQLRAVQPVGDRAEEDLVHERRLARARDARHAAEDAERELDVDASSGCAARRRAPRSRPSGLPPLRRHVDLPLAGQELAGERLRDPLHLAPGSPRATIWPPCSPAPGPEVDDVVGGAHRALVVLDHDHRVAEVAQPRQHVEQLVVVALVQPDRRLVEDVEDAHEARPDLRREPDPLRLAARERRRRPLERQVADPDAVEEAQALDDLLQDPGGDLPLGVAQLELVRASRSPRAPTCA